MVAIGEMPRVQGICPACGATSLFVASGGYITCARDTCPKPTAVADLLEHRIPYDRCQPHHRIEFRPGEYMLTHPIHCILATCPYQAIAAARAWQDMTGVVNGKKYEWVELTDQPRHWTVLDA